MAEASNVVSGFSDTYMSIGPWGGPEKQGQSWAYQPEDGKIAEIIIRHGTCIDSLVFQCKTTDGEVLYSNRFGGGGGTKTDKVLISPGEYIIGLKVMVAEFDKQIVVHQLCICTNVTTYGPFGTEKGNEISIPIEDGCIVGFFGRAKKYINAIGVYAVVKSSDPIKENKFSWLGNWFILSIVKGFWSIMGVSFENEMKKYERSIEGLEKALDELKVGGGVDLDEVREVAREIVERELEKHAADGLGRVDYAVAPAGGMVVEHSEPLSQRVNNNGVHDTAVKMLSPSFGEPGHCFCLKGSSGFVVIKLMTAIIPEAVTLEHVAKSVAYNRSTAPKDCRISGWLQKHEITDQTVKTHQKMTLLTEFTYDLEKSSAQTYNVLDTDPVVVDRIRLDFTSNHGNSRFTAIYRLRVHGREPDSNDPRVG